MIPLINAYSTRSCPRSSAIRDPRRSIMVTTTGGSGEAGLGLSPPWTRPSLGAWWYRKRGIEVRKVTQHLHANASDEPDQGRSDQAGEKTVLNQVLALILTNKPREQILHDSFSC